MEKSLLTILEIRGAFISVPDKYQAKAVRVLTKHAGMYTVTYKQGKTEIQYYAGFDLSVALNYLDNSL